MTWSHGRLPRIGLYAGTGASHSWLWLADLFDRLNLWDVDILDEGRIKAGGLRELDVLAVSGGDTFALAGALGADGASRIEAFVRGGGLYIGSCAGAYLPLRSSKPLLDQFNFVPARITNLTTALPEPMTSREKFSVPYGCAFIFHPVREAVQVKAMDKPPFAGAGTFPAPLYGGPAMIPGPGVEVLAAYAGFTPKTKFLGDRDLAAATLIGQAAVIRSPLGQGWFYLFGPHFEHPHFTEANRLMAEVIEWAAPRREPIAPTASNVCPASMCLTADSFMLDLKRAVSSGRMLAVGLETEPTFWTIGTKSYEPAKIMVFLEAVWSRLRAIEKARDEFWLEPDMPGTRARSKDENLPEGDFGMITQKMPSFPRKRESSISSTDFRITNDRYTALIDLAEEAVGLIRRVKDGLAAGRETQLEAERMFQALSRMSASFLTMYFRNRLVRTQTFSQAAGLAGGPREEIQDLDVNRQ